MPLSVELMLRLANAIAFLFACLGPSIAVASVGPNAVLEAVEPSVAPTLGIEPAEEPTPILAPRCNSVPDESDAAGISVTSISLGSALHLDKTVLAARRRFSRDDTIYVSVDTTGSGVATITAKWTFRWERTDVPVKEDSMTIDACGPATHEFHVWKPDGWPTGRYRVEIVIDGRPVGRRTYTVR